MTKQKTSIRINGKHYDALSGFQLNFETEQGPAKPAVRSIDGMVNGVTSQPQPAKPAKTAAMHTVAVPKPNVSRKPASHAKRAPAKPSKTLMRHTVSKPAASFKRASKTQVSLHSAHRAIIKPVAAPLPPKPSLRHQRAAQTSLSPRVSRFSQEAFQLTAKLETAVQKIDSAIVIPQPPTSRVQFTEAVVPAGVKSSDIFEQALLRATSHEEPAPLTEKGRRAARSLKARMISYTAGAVAVLALVGLFGSQSQQIQFRRASSQAGFSAVKPSYQPAGFSVANVKTSGGYIGLTYTNPSLGRIYAVTERPSGWNDQDLLDRIVNGNDQQTAYNQLQTNGRTVYVYGRNQAALVHQGILYQILGNGSLTSHDFEQIAASL